MATIEENLQALRDIKAGIKTSLENQNKEPTDSFASYSGLVDDLENPDDITYCVTLDGENKAYAQLYGQEEITLTATANDIRINTSAITGNGYTEGEKEIPSYFSSYGYKIVPANSEATLTIHECDYKKLMVTIATYDSSASESVSVDYTSVEDSMYESKSATKVADITKDVDNEVIKLGITVTAKSVLRYFVTREEI